MRTTRLASLILTALAAASTSTTGCRQVLDLPEQIECGSDDACTTADEPCLLGECIDGVCAYQLKPAGTVVDEAGEDDCTNNVCDENGDVVAAVASDDAPPDATPGDCRAPTCDVDGNIVEGAKDDDAPTEDAPGDCVRPACSDGAPSTTPNDADAPEDTVSGDCSSPACEAGAVVQAPNVDDAPIENIIGDCKSIVCDNGGMIVIDDTDKPTTGCGGCEDGVVVPWTAGNTACYTADDPNTENVGVCHGGSWDCIDNEATCVGEVTPTEEACGGSASGVDEDCNGQTDESGTGCLCQLGETEVCYSGPNGTEGVGICESGLRSCEAGPNGNSFGDCVGDVVPQTCDSCVQPGDQDCSGTAADCTLGHVWSKVLGGAGFEYGGDILELPNKEILVLTTFQNSITAPNTVTSDGGYDLALARFDEDGNAINIKDWGGTANDEAGFLVGLDDGYIVAGRLGDNSAEAFGTASTLTGVAGDGFLVKFDFNHSPQWKELIGGPAPDKLTGVVRMPDNGVAVCGQFQGTINLGGQNLTSAGLDDIFVARYSATGAHLWSKRFGNNMQNNVLDLAAAANGDLVIAGTTTSNISFGGPVITTTGGVDGYVARMDADGNHLWTRALQSTGNEGASKVGILSNGDTWVAGYFDTAVNLDGQPGAEISPFSDGPDMLLVAYSTAGNYLESMQFNGSGGTIAITGADVGKDDAIIFSGSYTGILTLAPMGLDFAAEGTDGFIVKLGPDGFVHEQRRVEGTGNEGLQAVHVGTCGDVFASGRFNESVGFGGGNLTSNGSQDIAIVKYRQ